MDPAFLDNLWRATDVSAVSAAMLPGGRVIRGDEWASKCPYCGDESKDPKFSVHMTDGKYKCFKCDESGNLITLAQRLWGKSWQAEWAAASPSAADVLGNPGAPPKPRAPRQPSKTPGKAYEEGKALLATNRALLQPLADAWTLPLDYLAGICVPVQEADRVAYGFPARDPVTGEVTDLKRRRLPPLTDETMKSQSWPGSRAGLFGHEALKEKPGAVVLVVEGEKKWAAVAHALPELAVVGIGMGAGTWVHPGWSEALKGRDVVLGHDHGDEKGAGDKGATKVADFIGDLASRVRRILPTQPGLNPPDLYDFLRGEGSPDALRALVLGATDFRPVFDPVRFMRNRIEGEMEGDEEPDWTALGEEAFKCLIRAGAKFIMLDGAVWCVYTGTLMKVSGRDQRWARLMLDMLGFTTVPSEGRILREVIGVRAAHVALIPDVSPAWCVYKGGAIYINQSNKRGSQIRIRPDSIEVVDNGADGVITVPNEGVMPIEFLSDADGYDHQGAMAVVDKASGYYCCEAQSREFLKWYTLTMFLYPLAQTHPVVRFRGDSASGKSTCAKALTAVLYGAPYLISSTQAALYRSARRRPLTAIDNLEERDFGKDPELQNFVLVSATGRAREKSARDSDSEVVREEVKSLFLSTGIEPVGIDKPEIVNRTIEVFFDARHATNGFYEQGFLDHLAKERVYILNAAMRLTQDVLRDVAGGKLQKVMKTFPADKRRLAEFFCLMSLAQSGGEEVNECVVGWTKMMGESERRTHVEGNPVAPIILAIPKVEPSELGLPYTRTGTKIVTDPVRAPDLFRALCFVAKRYGLRVPYGDPQTMATRLGGEGAKSLEQYGITLEKVRSSSGERMTRLTISTEKPAMEGELFP